MNHDWVTEPSLQWAERGFGYDAAATPFHCSVCGVKFTHFYHQQPNIYKAMAEAGIGDECPRKSEKGDRIMTDLDFTTLLPHEQPRDDMERLRMSIAYFTGANAAITALQRLERVVPEIPEHVRVELEGRN